MRLPDLYGRRWAEVAVVFGRMRLKLGVSVSLPDHCMVNFIKENLLGSIKEFRNRFINPIQNGQCADSTLHDVRIMKKRAHILYEMLAGCVQVRDEWLK